MSDNSSIHGGAGNHDNDNSGDEGISSSGLYVNQKSILNNFNVTNRQFTFGAPRQQNPDDEEMPEDSNEDGENFEGDEDNVNNVEDNAYSSQEDHQLPNQASAKDEEPSKNEEEEEEAEQEAEGGEEEENENFDDFSEPANGNQHLQVPPADVEEEFNSGVEDEQMLEVPPASEGNNGDIIEGSDQVMLEEQHHEA